MNKFHCYTQGKWFGYEAKLFLDTLNNTKLNYLDLLIRESIQNSFDAKVNGLIPNYIVHGRSLTSSQSRFLREMLDNDGYSAILKSKIKDNLFCLEVRDSNTTGLMGAYQQYDANDQEIESEYSNYKSFIWSLGGSKTNNLGGSHGVGKTSFFISSSIRTVCIYTRTKYNGNYQSRFIIKSFYGSDENNQKQYWFGNDPSHCASKKEQIPLPFLDDEADKIAFGLGIKPYGFNETGTSVFVLDADFNIDNEETKRKISNKDYYQENVVPLILKWFWPKLSDLTPNNKKININVFYEGNAISIPNLSESDYEFFNSCFIRWNRKFNEIKNYDNDTKCQLNKEKNFIPISGVRPKVFTGGIVYGRTSYISDKQKQLFFANDNNVCLIYMRDIEFCVKYKGYLATNLAPGEFVFAIFHTDPVNSLPKINRVGSVDNAFRLSEDNSHEEWNPNFIQDDSVAKSCVKVTLQKIDEAIEKEFSFQSQTTKAMDTSGSLALALGKLLPWNHGIGGSRRNDSESTPRSGGAVNKKESIPKNFVMIAPPAYLDNEYRRLKFLLIIKNPVLKPVVAKLQVITIDGRVDSQDLVELINVKYQVPRSNMSVIALNKDTKEINLKWEGRYIFEFLAKGDIEFTCDLKIKEEN